MRRWLEIVLTLVLFAVVMSVASWAVNATVPGAVDWAWDRFGGVAVWAVLIVLIGGSGLYAWHGHRKAGTKPKGTYPRR